MFCPDQKKSPGLSKSEVNWHFYVRKREIEEKYRQLYF
jgi:hypothetical protein